VEIRDELARRDLADAEAKRAADAERRRVAIETASLLDFVPLASPKLVAPRHLAPLVALFERIDRGERVRAVIDVPAGVPFLIAVSAKHVSMLAPAPVAK